MSRSIESFVLATAGLLAVSPVLAADPKPPVSFGFGTVPTSAELEAFVSPQADGRGLPPGSGSAADGAKVYQTQCAACHGAELQGGLGDRLIGGRGTLVNGDPTKAPVKTVESYWPYSTTLFDYIKRAMPMTAPGSLSNDDVYALCAYILSEAKIVPADAVLGQTTLAQVKMPNRDGFIPDHRPEHFPPAAATPHADKKMVSATK